MNQTASRNLLVVLLLAVFAGSASAQDGKVATQPDAGKQTAQANQARFDMRASELIGREVFSRRGHSVGEIQDLFVDANAQQVRYAVLAFGGVLGLGDKLFAFPMRAFHYSPDSDALRLDVDLQTLQYAPGFERDTWPNYGDPRFFEEVDRFFGEEAKRTRAPAMLRGTALIGRDVNDLGGRDVGEVQDFVVDLGGGRIPYFLLAADKAWSLEDKLLPLPLSVLGFPRERGEDLVLHVDPSTLRMARGIERDAWPDLNASVFRREVDANVAAVERRAEVQSGASGN